MLAWKPDKLRGERFKHEKVVIIKNLFTREMIEKDCTLILEYQNGLRAACSKFGTVKKVIIYDVSIPYVQLNFLYKINIY